VSALREAAPPLPYEPGEWLGNFDRAKLIAEQKNKPMLIYFSGTDWCKWCWRLDEEVLDKEEAKSYIKDKFVLLKLDFLRKSPMPTKLAQQNRRVAKRYGHKFFPTLILTDAQGERLGKTGYIKGGPQAFKEKMEGFLKEEK
jgi:protein disulfide-isomerase